MHYVYLIKCLDGKVYTGRTKNIFRRIKEHKTGIGGAIFTRIHGFLKVIHVEKYATKEEAHKREWEIKLWDHESKMKLASGNLETPRLSMWKRKYISKTNPFIQPKNLMTVTNAIIFKQILSV